MFAPNLSKILVKENSAAINLFRTLPVNWGYLTPAKVEDVTDLIHEHTIETMKQTHKAIDKLSVVIAHKGGKVEQYQFENMEEMMTYRDKLPEIKRIAEDQRNYIISNEIDLFRKFELTGDLTFLGPISKSKLEAGRTVKQIESFLKSQSTIELFKQRPNLIAKYIKPAGKDIVVYENAVIMNPKGGDELVISDERRGTEPFKLTLEDIHNKSPHEIPRGKELSPEEFEKQKHKYGYNVIERNKAQKTAKELEKLRREEYDALIHEKLKIDHLKKKIEETEKTDLKAFNKLNDETQAIYNVEEQIEEAIDDIKKAKFREEETKEETKRLKKIKKERNEMETLRKQEDREAKGKTKEKEGFDVDRDKRTELIGVIKRKLVNAVPKEIEEYNLLNQVNGEIGLNLESFKVKGIGLQKISKAISILVNNRLHRWREDPIKFPVDELSNYLNKDVKQAVYNKAKKQEIYNFIDDITIALKSITK